MDYDIIIIGSGPGGYKAAVTAAFMGAKVALIEKNLPGGNCLNQGCVPTKSLIHVAELLEDIQLLQGKGIYGDLKADFDSAVKHKDKVISNIRNNFPVWLKRLGVHYYQASASFIDAHQIHLRYDQASSQATPQATSHTTKANTITAKHIVIATGSHPITHEKCQTDGAIILNSEDFMYHLKTIPRSVLFVGGGAIGVELGYVMHQFGSKVTIVEQSKQLLNTAKVPDRARGLLQRKFKQQGIKFRTNVSVASSTVSPSNATITFTDGLQENYDNVIVAIGRAPNTTELNLSNTNIAIDDDGFIITNQYLETAEPHIYAIGDVKQQGPSTANAALHDAKIAATNACQGNQLTSNYHKVPTVIYSSLQIASVGLSEDQADAAGFEPEVARSNFSASVKALTQHETEGYTEITHDEETGQLLGGCIVGRDAGEQIQMLTAAVQSERGLWFFNDINYSHPSWCEELENTINPFTSEFTRSGNNVFRPGIYAPATKNNPK